jgi:hypothetical protein
MSVEFRRNAWCYVSEDRTLRNHRCHNIKSYTARTCLFHFNRRRYRVIRWYFVLYKITNQSTTKLISYLMCTYNKLNAMPITNLISVIRNNSVLTAISIQFSDLWLMVLTPYSSGKAFRSFWGTYYLHLHGGIKMYNYQFVSSSQDVLLYLDILELQANSCNRKQDILRYETKSANLNSVKAQIGYNLSLFQSQNPNL